MISVVIIGTGNVAENLFHALIDAKEVNLLQVVGRNDKALEYYKDRTKVSSGFERIEDADIYILAVSDKAIPPVAEKVLNKSGIVVHTSGATPMDSIITQKRGVFYPLQTFTKERLLDFSTIPIGIESSDNESLATLRKLGEAISQKVYDINSDQRKKLHLAAVFANNFSNHLFHISETLCEKEDLPFELLKPLILETVKKLETLSPKDAQTGPARRDDSTSIEKHLELLTNANHKKIYTLLSEAITKTYEKEL
ncbi:MAG: Rossmann-like and DUF2520 domain-containing protein [Bacteroidota bacterium]